MSDLHAFTVDLSRPHNLPWLEFEIPCPPSKNRKMGKLGNSSPVVQAWRQQAGKEITSLPFHERQKINAGIKGKFEAEFYFGRNNRADFPNYEEFLLDWFQARGFIENDRLIEWRASGWSDDVPKGRVVVRLRRWIRP
jgi:hypothetical protein